MTGPAINMADDGVGLTPKEMSEALVRLTRDGEIEADYYGDGGPVSELEAEVARRLGKERAIMFPTGTLGNMLAMRLMADAHGPRVIVQRDSHLFNDAGDNITLAGITMVPLASGGPNYDADQVKAEIARTASARVQATLGGICIESPNRRHANRLFDPGQRAAIEALAQAEGIPLFLDAARIFIEAAWTGRTPADIAAPYDFTYLSLYKYLSAPFGAVLAGPAEALEGLYHERRRHGGGLYQMWVAALLALDALPRQAADWQAAREAGGPVLSELEKLGVEVTRFDDGTNGVILPAGQAATRADAVKAQTGATGIKLLPAAGGRLTLKMNASWARETPERLARRLAELLRA